MKTGRKRRVDKRMRRKKKKNTTVHKTCREKKKKKKEPASTPQIWRQPINCVDKMRQKY